MKINSWDAIIPSKSKVEDGQMKKVLKVIVIIAAVYIAFLIIVNIFLAFQVNRSMEWDLQETFSAEDKEYFGNISMYPDAVPYMERYAKKGWRDTEYRIETIRFGNKEKLFEALPNCEEGVSLVLEQVKPEKTKDLGKSDVSEYEISILPLKKEEELSDKYIYDSYFRSFYIDVYEDGSVRLILDVSNT